MNLGFLATWHAPVALASIALFVTWHLVAPLPFGDRGDPNVPFLLTTGWFAVAAYVVLALYAARRAAHRLRLSPEFGWAARLSQLERAQTQLTELQNRVRRREIGGKAAIQRAARAILTDHGVRRVLRVGVRPDRSGLGQFEIQVQPRDAIGRMSCWLSAHVWYGVAAALLVFFHGGGRCGSTMGLLLNVLSYFVIASGLLGALFWAWGPTLLTRAERELTIEKAVALREHFARKVADAEAALSSAPDRRQRALADVAAAERKVEDAGRQDDKKARKAAEKELKKAKAAVAAIDREVSGLPSELAVLTGQQQRVARETARLERYRTLLRGWRLFHVPASIVLLALVAVHVLSIWYY
ncbi:MAG TPA: hypothetical protein ENI87_14120 [bacterium]|nr:hypothetical protein [bacterium]